MALENGIEPYLPAGPNHGGKTGIWYNDKLAKRPPLGLMLASWLSPEDQPVTVDFVTAARFLNPRSKTIPMRIMTMSKEPGMEHILCVDGVWKRPDGVDTYLRALIDLTNESTDNLAIVDAIGLRFTYVE